MRLPADAGAKTSQKLTRRIRDDGDPPFAVWLRKVDGSEPVSLLLTEPAIAGARARQQFGRQPSSR